MFSKFMTFAVSSLLLTNGAPASIGSAAAAAQGISVNSFPPGTIFSVGMHPLRSGEQAGSREGNLYKCPAKTPPAAGKHCDSVDGSTKHGEGALAIPKD